MQILGILNITSDSFSDGGKYLEPGAAIFHARAMAESGADIIDIGAASSHPDAEAVAPDVETALAKSDVRLIVMHMVQERGVAVRTEVPSSEIFDRVTRFFDVRVQALRDAGIARERLILDPGMGQFLGTDPENSWIVLRRLPELKARYGLPLLVSLSRKGFLRKLVNRPPLEAGAASLAAELFAEANGADYIRTHTPGPLKDGLKVLKTIGKGQH